MTKRWGVLLQLPLPDERGFRLLALSFVVALAAHAPALAKCDEGEAVIKLSHTAPLDGHPKSAAAGSLAARVNDALNGRYCMYVYPNSTRYNDNDVLQALANNEVQIAIPPTAIVGDTMPSLRIFDLPFLFDDMDAVERFQSTPIMKSQLSSLEAGGWLAVAFWNDGMKQMGANRSIKLPHALKNLRIRVSDSQISIAKFAASNANIVPLPFKETYPALIKGSIDGQEDTWTNVYSKRFFEVASHMAETNHSALVYVVLVASDFYKGLDTNTQAELHAIIRSVSDENNKRAKAMSANARAKILEEGGVIYELRDLQRAAWMQVLQPVWTNFAHQVDDDLIELAREANQS